MQAFLDGTQNVLFEVKSTKQERYKEIASFLTRFKYKELKRADKGVFIRFLMKLTGYSRQQLTRLIQQHGTFQKLVPQQRTSNGFQKKFTDSDKPLLAKLDQLHGKTNRLTLKKLCERAYTLFGDEHYQRLAHISKSHIYNLRRSKSYLTALGHSHEGTKGNQCPQIGKRVKRKPKGEPGFIRIDTVHQVDFKQNKGVYHINAVDEVTQYQVVMSVEKISEAYLHPILEEMLNAFPFKIQNFHSDNGSEFINHTVARLLEKLRIEFTKSRTRRSTDNALVEGKNGAVVRKIFGYDHIPKKFATQLNEFNRAI